MCYELWIGVVGTLAGAGSTLGGVYLTHYLGNQKQSKLESLRKPLLRRTLDNAGKDGWMSIEALAQIVGANLDDTRGLLIQIEARGSMKVGKEMWSLISRNPLPTTSD